MNQLQNGPENDVGDLSNARGNGDRAVGRLDRDIERSAPVQNSGSHADRRADAGPDSRDEGDDALGGLGVVLDHRLDALEVAHLELVGHVIELHERVELVQEPADLRDLRDETHRRVEHTGDELGAVDERVPHVLRRLARRDARHRVGGRRQHRLSLGLDPDHQTRSGRKAVACHGPIEQLTPEPFTITFKVNGAACSSDATCQTALSAAPGQTATVTATYPCSAPIGGVTVLSGCTLTSTTTDMIE